MHTDGKTLNLSWESGGAPGSLVIDLYAPIKESETGPARLRQGVFTLSMRKVEQAQWPAFSQGPGAASSKGAAGAADAAAADDDADADGGIFSSCFAPCLGDDPDAPKQ